MKLTVYLPDEHYRPLLDLAQSKGCRDVGELLSRAAPLLLEQPRPSRRPYVRMTPDLRKRMVELRRAGKNTADIARELGVSRSSVWNHLHGGAR